MSLNADNNKKRFKLFQGDNMISLKKLPDNSIDSIVSDPPYGLSFMNKKWDYDVPSVEFWKEVYRVLKPGGHVLSFGGTRTYHRMAVNIEDAGFEIRDQIQWIYGSGFPKSHNIGKAVDKLQGNEREVVGIKENWHELKGSDDRFYVDKRVDLELTKGTTPQEGWGTALKPANEPICVARKPLSEKSVAENVIKWGTGGINIDGCRIGTTGGTERSGLAPYNEQGWRVGHTVVEKEEGRFPANIIFECICDELVDGGVIKSGSNNRTDKGVVTGNLGFGRGTEVERHTQIQIHTNPECPCYMLDEQSGNIKSTGSVRKKENEYDGTSYKGKNELGRSSNPYAGEKGGSSRFFYVAKVSKSERNMGLDGFEEKKSRTNQINSEKWLHCEATVKKDIVHKNTHPTLKPVQLMSYLVRLVTPPNGIVLDPFMGSGSTGIATLLEGFRFCGMEMDPDYFKISEARIESYELYRSFVEKKKKK